MSLITKLLSQLSRSRISGMRRQTMRRKSLNYHRWSDLYSRLMSVEPLEDRTLLSALQILHDRTFLAPTPSASSAFGQIFDANDSYVAISAWKKNVGALTNGT